MLPKKANLSVHVGQTSKMLQNRTIHVLFACMSVHRGNPNAKIHLTQMKSIFQAVELIFIGNILRSKCKCEIILCTHTWN